MAGIRARGEAAAGHCEAAARRTAARGWRSGGAPRGGGGGGGPGAAVGVGVIPGPRLERNSSTRNRSATGPAGSPASGSRRAVSQTAARGPCVCPHGRSLARRTRAPEDETGDTHGGERRPEKPSAGRGGGRRGSRRLGEARGLGGHSERSPRGCGASRSGERRREPARAAVLGRPRSRAQRGLKQMQYRAEDVTLPGRGEQPGAAMT